MHSEFRCERRVIIEREKEDQWLWKMPHYEHSRNILVVRLFAVVPKKIQIYVFSLEYAKIQFILPEGGWDNRGEGD
jgi:hypothetical protein